MTSAPTTAMLAPSSSQGGSGAGGLPAALAGGDFAKLMKEAILRPGSDVGAPPTSPPESGADPARPPGACVAVPHRESDSGTVADGVDAEPPSKMTTSSQKGDSQDASVPCWVLSLVAGTFWQPSLASATPEPVHRSGVPDRMVPGVPSEGKGASAPSPLNLVAGAPLTATSTDVPVPGAVGSSLLLSKILEPEVHRPEAATQNIASGASQFKQATREAGAAPQDASEADLRLASPLSVDQTKPGAAGGTGNAASDAGQGDGVKEAAADRDPGLTTVTSDAGANGETKTTTEALSKIRSGGANALHTISGEHSPSPFASPVQGEALNSAPGAEHGMSDACPPGTMQAMLEANESSSASEQILPISSGIAGALRSMARARGLSDEAAKSDSPLSGGGAAVVSSQGEQSAGGELASQAKAPATSASAQAAIEHAALGLPREAGASVSLVLRPDGDTQLALHMKWNQGRLDALAVVEQGDVAALGANWSQLQDRLAQHGVRLAPLAEASNHFGSSAGGHSGPGKQDAQADRAANRWDESPKSAPSLARRSTPPIVRQPTLAGREWWA